MDLKQGDLENIILNALWDLETQGHGKIFVGDVQEKIKSHKKWAYTTVKTVLDRLVDKDIAGRQKEGKKYIYHSVIQRENAGLLALKKLLRQYFKNDVNELIACAQSLQNIAQTSSSSSSALALNGKGHASNPFAHSTQQPDSQELDSILEAAEQATL